MKKPLFTALIIILITLPTILPFFNRRFFYTQDYIFIARLQQMSTALSSGQFPVRWTPDLRYGEPIFNFYAPLPYYLGAIIHFFGFNFIWTAKILFILSALFSALSMYLLANKLFGRQAGFLAAVLYTYAPYKAVDMYVRGSLSETWAFIFFPLIFYNSLLLARQFNLKNFTFLGFSLAGLFLTHNVTTIMFLPFLFIWWLYLILREKKFIISLRFFSASILGLGLSAFFLLPAIVERSLIQTKYLIVGYFNFRAHFVAIKQFFSIFWGYGSSLWGPEDGLSFQVGLVNFAVLAIAAILALFYRKDKNFLLLMLLVGLSFLFSIFLQHNKSAFIWEAIPLMAFIQFPWRFLGISIFIVSLAGGAITPFLKNKLRPLYFILIIAAILSTLAYFKPKDYVDDSFFDKFLNIEPMHKGIDLTKDYLPIWVQTVDGERFDIPRGDQINVSDIKKTSTSMQFSVNATNNTMVEVPVTYFPGWEVSLDSQIISQSEPSKMGLIRFLLPEGDHTVMVIFKDTLIRTIGNALSLGSIIFLVFIFVYKYKIRQ